MILTQPITAVQPDHDGAVGSAPWAPDRALNPSPDDKTKTACPAVSTALSGAMIARANGLGADAAEE
ncbi:hypothetical protein [Pseudoruegeria sp. SK021]|uniref:hypothetical protein n=1 Tax=Pseudoruegeria sp. SK021 TaxID=1933035 RepID=UPI000A238779|nr:hypothetical protein [Pseudoruegeria sp. SK021]OSP56434.1 hypothetical protein BV911_00240 [Pseudoruegeria sp. SK021]